MMPWRRTTETSWRRSTETRWVFHLRRNCDVAGTHRETSLLPDGNPTGHPIGNDDPLTIYETTIFGGCFLEKPKKWTHSIL